MDLIKYAKPMKPKLDRDVVGQQIHVLLCTWDLQTVILLNMIYYSNDFQMKNVFRYLILISIFKMIEEEVVKYVIEKYGQEHVAGVATFNTYGPKVAIKDLGKVINIPLPRLERLSSLVPTSYKLKKSAFEMYNTSAQFPKQWSIEITIIAILCLVFF